MIRGEPFSELSKKYYREVRSEGLAEGVAQGLARGVAESLLTVLAARGLRPTPTQQATILACKDPQQLQRWIELAVTANRIDELFTE